MKNKKTILVSTLVFFIILSLIVIANYVPPLNVFNTADSAVNITFLGDSNNTTNYLNIRMTHNTTSAVMSLKGYATEDWTANADLIVGLTDVGSRSSPAIADFNLDGKYELISGKLDGTWSAWFWNGSGWTENASLTGGLTDIGVNSAPAIADFNNDSVYELISGNGYGNWSAWFWNGTGWTANASLTGGLTDVGARSAPAIADFNLDGKYELISGEQTAGAWNAWFWNGSGWTANASLTGGLTDIGQESDPDIADFNLDGVYELISGGFDGGWDAWFWNGTGWTANASLTGGLTDVGTNSAPAIADFNLDGVYELIGGEHSGVWNGWFWSSQPSNVDIDIGSDGDLEFDGAGNLTNNVTADFSVEINEHIDLCTCTGCVINGAYCRVPIAVYSDTAGIVELLNLSIEYNNTAPYASNVNVTPDSADWTDTLECEYDFNDLDDDAENTNSTITEWYVDGVSQSGYVAYYPMNNNTTTTAWDRYGANDGVVNGAAWTSEGRQNGAYEFDGVNDFITLSNNSSFNLVDEITVAVWIYAHPHSSSAHSIIEKENKSYWQLQTWGGDAANSRFRFYVNNTGALNSAGTSYSDAWHHIVGTFNGSHISLFIDGVLIDNTTYYGKIPVSSNSIFVGRIDPAPVRYFNGTIDEVKIFSKGLSAGEVYDLYNNSYLKNLTSGFTVGSNVTCSEKVFDEFGMPDDAFVNSSFKMINKVNNNSISINVNPSNNVPVGTTVDVTCIPAAGDSNLTLYLAGVEVGHPYSSEPPQGNNNFTCFATHSLYNDTSATEFVLVGVGNTTCTDAYTYARRGSLTVSNNVTTVIDFNAYKSVGWVNPDLSDVNASRPILSVNSTRYLVVNTTGEIGNVLNVSFGNMFINNSPTMGGGAPTPTDNFSAVDVINNYAVFTLRDEVTQSVSVPLNSTGIAWDFYCAGGHNYIDMGNTTRTRFLAATKTSQWERARVTVEYEDGSEYFRHAIIDNATAIRTMWVVDAVSFTVVRMTTFLNDYTALFSGGELQIRKWIGTNLEIVDGQYFDASNYQVWYGILGNEYQFGLISLDGANTRTIGNIVVDSTDTDKILTISNVGIDNVEIQGTIKTGWSYDNNTGLFEFYYEDPYNRTVEVNMTVYNMTVNNTVGGQIYFTTSSNSTTIFSYTVPDTALNYQIVIQYYHLDSVLDVVIKIIIGVSGAFQGETFGIYGVYAAMGIVFGLAMSFSKRFAPFGLIVVGFTLFMFHDLGFIGGYVSLGIISLALLLSVLWWFRRESEKP